MDVSALNLGMIAAYYNISCTLLTIFLFTVILTCAYRCYYGHLQAIVE